MIRLHVVATLTLWPLLSGCATITQGTTQPVSVITAPEQGAQCSLANSQGTWYVTTPGSAVVQKTKTDLAVDCKKAGFAAGHLVSVAHFGGATFGNILLGGLIGAGVDAASGANYSYDSPITVPLGERDSVIPPLPKSR